MIKEKICVFGMGLYYSAKKETLSEKYEIVAFIDNRVSVGKTEKYEDVIVYNPKDWTAEHRDISIVLMAADWYGMWSQLKELGISDEHIVLSYNMRPFYDRTEEFFADNGIEIWIRFGKIVVFDGKTEQVVNDVSELQGLIRNTYLDKDPLIKAVIDMPQKPSSTRFGLERGTPIDRVFIERFLDENRECIHGTVIEIGDDRYMKKYSDLIDNPVILHVNGWGGLKGNLATGEGIVENYADCLICTQTLQHIYDIRSSIANIYRLLKPSGTALITNGCIGELSLYDYNNWGEYWKCTDMAMKELFCECFENEKIDVKSYGNVKMAIGFLYGMCAEDFSEEDFNYQDVQYPMIVAIKVQK